MFKIHLILNSSKPSSSKWTLPYTFLTTILYSFLSSPTRVLCLAYVIPLHLSS
jgi:hypothetical protein